MPRDPRFVAEHRGGLLSREHHRLLAGWAADCAERVLPSFERHRPDDDRPRRAIEVGRLWAAGGCATGVAMKASLAAHAAAREADEPAAIAAARAAGQGVATAHMAGHALGPWIYGLKAVRAIDASLAAAEHEACVALLPEAVRALVVEAMRGDRFRRAVPEASDALGVYAPPHAD